MLVKDFIKGPFLNEIQDMAIKEPLVTHAYLGYSLICLGVEFLGACLDQYDWGEKHMSEKRFRLAILELFPNNYYKYNSNKQFDLYSGLRCSLVHSLRPGSNIGLSERKHYPEYIKIHLTEQNGKLILIFEDFLKDFQDACKKVLDKIENKLICNKKVYDHIIDTPQDHQKINNVGQPSTMPVFSNFKQ